MNKIKVAQEIIKLAKKLLANEPWTKDGKKAISNNLSALNEIVDKGEITDAKLIKKYIENLKTLFTKAKSAFDESHLISHIIEKKNAPSHGKEYEEWLKTDDGIEWKTAFTREVLINSIFRRYIRFEALDKPLPAIETQDYLDKTIVENIIHKDETYKKTMDDFNYFINSWIPVLELCQKAQPLASVKVTKKMQEEEKKKEWLKPHQSTKSLSYIREELEKIIKEHYGEMLKALEEGKMRKIERYSKLVDSWNIEKEKSTLTGMELGKQYRSFFRTNIEHYVDEDDWRIVVKNEGGGILSINPNVETAMKEKAKKQADFMHENYVIKNMAKLSAIVSEKEKVSGAGIKNIEAKGAFKILTFIGTLYFTFTDDSYFTVINQGVFVVNKFGTMFYRFPTTFHDVGYPNGDKKAMVPEEHMVEEWAKFKRD